MDPSGASSLVTQSSSTFKIHQKCICSIPGCFLHPRRPQWGWLPCIWCCIHIVLVLDLAPLAQVTQPFLLRYPGCSCLGGLNPFHEVFFPFIQEHGCCLGYLWVLGLADVPFSIGTQVPRSKGETLTYTQVQTFQNLPQTANLVTSAP